MREAVADVERELMQQNGAVREVLALSLLERSFGPERPPTYEVSANFDAQDSYLIRGLLQDLAHNVTRHYDVRWASSGEFVALRDEDAPVDPRTVVVIDDDDCSL